MPAASGRDSVLRVDRKLFHLGRSGDSFAGDFQQPSRCLGSRYSVKLRLGF